MRNRDGGGQGSIYATVIDEVINSSRVDFEEAGVNSLTLDDLKKVSLIFLVVVEVLLLLLLLELFILSSTVFFFSLSLSGYLFFSSLSVSLCVFEYFPLWFVGTEVAGSIVVRRWR